MTGTFGTLPGRAVLGRRPRRRWRTSLRRQPLAFWALAAAAALLAWWGTHQALDVAAGRAAAHGGLVEVVVAERDVAPGEPVDDAVRLAAVPATLVPADALSAVPSGSVARERLLAGEAVASSRLAPQGSVGLAAELGPGERAVAVPTDGPHVPIRVGQRVDVLATVDPSLAGRVDPTSVVASAARVLAVDDDAITVAVDEASAHDLATALATAVVTVVVAPG